MAYVNVAEWSPDQVAEWLKGKKSLIKKISTYIKLVNKSSPVLSYCSYGNLILYISKLKFIF